MKKFRFLLVPMFLVLACAISFAQANSSVAGIVTDQTGAVVSGAKIVLSDPATGATKTVESSSAGLYEITGLNPATYNLKIAAKGFEAFLQNGVVVNVSSTARVDVKLTVGAETQTVTVEADALAIQSDSNVVSTLINEQQITEIATENRNLVALASLGLGASGNLPDNNTPTSVGSNFTISFNGLNYKHNIWLIDGGEAADRGSGGGSALMPSMEALGEFQVLASNYPPEYGISSGATISMAIKGGNQKFHATAWEFGRNDALQGHNYFDAVGAKKPELRQNIFGANGSGPVFIPGMYNSDKKKTFFFWNEEWRKIVTGSAPAGIHAVPTADFLTSKPTAPVAWAIPAYNSGSTIKVPTVASTTALGQAIAADGLTPGGSFTNNMIPANLFTDASVFQFNAVGAIPEANASGDLVSLSAKQPTNVREDLVRIDHNFNEKWQIFGHYIHDAVSQTYATSMWSSDSYPTVGSTFTNPANGAVIKLTGSLSPKVLLEASINYDGNVINIQPSGTAFTQPSGWSASDFFGSNDPKHRLPSVNLGTYGTEFDPWSQPWHNAAGDFAEIVSLSYTTGSHNLKFGFGYNRYTKNQQIFGNTNGFYDFSSSTSATGDSYLDFMLGLASDYSQLETQDIRHYVNQTPSVYAEDNWHVNSRLSLQYGFRYDALAHAWERNNRVSSFDPTQYQSALAPVLNANGSFASNSPGLQVVGGGIFYLNGVILPMQGGTPRGLTKNDFNTFQPRLGFTYDLFGGGKTVLRGGFGTFFERMQGNDIYNVAAAAPYSNTPKVYKTTFSNPYLSWSDGSQLSNATLPVVPQGMTSIAQNYKAPGVAQYSIGVQHEIQPSLILVAQYVGNIEWHQNLELPINELPLSTSLANRQKAAGGLGAYDNAMMRTYQGYGNISQESNLATGTYNGLQVGLRQQNRHGLTFEIDYTYSHEIDSEPGSTDLNAVSNPWNIKYDRASGTLDRRHIVNANYAYKLPIFNAAKGLTHSVLGGWELSGTFIDESGLPWAGNSNNGPGWGGADTVGLGGDYTIRPNFTGKPHYVKSRAADGVYQWVDKTGFSAPVAAWNGGPNLGFGNASRDVVVGPGRVNFSTDLYKSFQITEGSRFEFRAESFNTFNHTQFNAFHSNFSGSDFGEVSGAQDPRTFELGGKLIF